MVVYSALLLSNLRIVLLGPKIAPCENRGAEWRNFPFCTLRCTMCCNTFYSAPGNDNATGSDLHRSAAQPAKRSAAGVPKNHGFAVQAAHRATALRILD